MNTSEFEKKHGTETTWWRPGKTIYLKMVSKILMRLQVGWWDSYCKRLTVQRECYVRWSVFEYVALVSQVWKFLTGRETKSFLKKKGLKKAMLSGYLQGMINWKRYLHLCGLQSFLITAEVKIDGEEREVSFVQYMETTALLHIVDGNSNSFPGGSLLLRKRTNLFLRGWREVVWVWERIMVLNPILYNGEHAYYEM